MEDADENLFVLVFDCAPIDSIGFTFWVDSFLQVRSVVLSYHDTFK